MLQVVAAAHRYQHGTRPGVHAAGFDLRLLLEVELFQAMNVNVLVLLQVDLFGDGEQDKEGNSESDAVDGGVLF